ncbi:MAG: hypothetical protein ACLQDF_16790 [Desulfomonilia bacterium]
MSCTVHMSRIPMPHPGMGLTQIGFGCLLRARSNIMEAYVLNPYRVV